MKNTEDGALIWSKVPHVLRYRNNNKPTYIYLSDDLGAVFAGCDRLRHQCWVVRWRRSTHQA